MAINDPWPSVDPGQFRHQVTLLEQQINTDASGSSFSYAADTPPITAWAKIEYLRGADRIQSGQDVSQVWLKVTMWYRAEFTANKRIQFQGNQYVIQAVENVAAMNTYQVLMCLGIGPNQ